MFKKSTLLGTSTLIAAAIAMPAAAQIQDEIIVTATKRATTLQATPVAVTVTSQDTIEKANISDILDLQSVVPSLRVNQLQSSIQTNFIIRGFGNGANNAGIEPSVGVFIDGVYRSRSAASIGNLPNLQRVEVLKGPQSTLFGKNASAGVVSIVTSKPQFDSEGYVELGYGNYNAFSAKAYVTDAISENVAFSLGGGFNKRNGYAESIIGLDDMNDRNRYSIRGQLLFQPADNVEFRLIGDYSNIDENCCVVTNVVSSATTGVLNALVGGPATSPINDPYSYVSYANKNAENTQDDYGVSFHADIGFDSFDVTSITSYRTNESFYSSDQDFNLANLLDFVKNDQETNTITQEIRLTSNTDGMVDWMLGGYLFEESVSQNAGLQYGNDLRSYIDLLAGGPAVLGALEAFNGFDAGTFFAGGAGTDEFFTQDNSAWSVFGTLDFHVSDRLTLTAGANYTDDRKNVTGFTNNTDAFSALDLNTANGIDLLALGQVQAGFATPTVGVGAAFSGAFGGLPFTPTNFANVDAIVMVPGAQAGFLAGVQEGVRGALRPLQFQPPFLAFPNSVEDGKSNDSKLTYNVRAAYEASDWLNVYASYATGFKSSSWNLSRDSRPFPGSQAALVGAGLDQTNQAYGTRLAFPEKARVIEVGAKTRFDNATLNVALFQQTLKDFQSNAFVGTAFVLTNAGETRVNGAEVEGTWSPFDPLTLSFAGTFLDAEYTDFANASGPAGVGDGTIDLTGTTPSTISDVSLSFGATYNFDLSDNIGAYIRGDFQYESPADQGFNLSLEGLALSAAENPLYTTTGFVPGFEEREQKMANASASVEFDNGVELQIWARNLFNDQFLSTLFPGVAQFGVINAYPSPPRTYGINAKYNF